MMEFDFPLPTQISAWKTKHVSKWLHGLGLGQYISVFEANSVHGPLLLTLEEEDLEVELEMNSKLHRRKLILEIERQDKRRVEAEEVSNSRLQRS